MEPGRAPLWPMLCQQPPRHAARQPSRWTIQPPANRPGTGLLHLPGSPVEFTKELVSHKQGPVHLAVPPGRHCAFLGAKTSPSQAAAQHMKQRREAMLASLCSVLVLNKSSVREGRGGGSPAA